MERAADDGHPVQALGKLAVLLDESHRRLNGRVRKRHHVRVRRGLQTEPAREIRVQDVESARAEPELARLNVHEHVVSDLDRARQPRIRDARLAVDLDPR